MKLQTLLSYILRFLSLSFITYPFFDTQQMINHIFILPWE